MLNRNPEHNFQINSSVRRPPKFSESISRLYQWVESNEEIRIANLVIQKSQVQTKLSNYTSLPDFNIGARYTQVGQRNDVSDLSRNGRDGLAISIGINIPLNRTKNSAVKRQARLNQLRKVKDKQALRNTLRNKVKAIYFKINNSYRQTQLYSRNLIPQANRAMQIAQLQYRENKGSISQYLETQSTWLNFQLAYQRAVADYWKNLIDMEKLTGRKL